MFSDRSCYQFAALQALPSRIHIRPPPHTLPKPADGHNKLKSSAKIQTNEHDLFHQHVSNERLLNH